MNNLTPKQQRFVTEYLRDLNATAAAVRAGYSERTANQQGPRLLEIPAVAAAIDAAKLARSIETGVDNRVVLRRLVDEADADLKDLFDPKTNDLLPVEQWPPVWRKGLVQSVEIEALFDGHGKDRVQIGHVKRVRLSDRLRRLELIGKHVKVNAFQETVNHNGYDGLGDRLEEAFKRLEAAKTDESRASAAPAPLDNGDAALQRATDAARRYFEAEKSSAPPTADTAPVRETPQEQAAPPQKAVDYKPIWPQSTAFADMGDDDEAPAPYRNR